MLAALRASLLRTPLGFSLRTWCCMLQPPWLGGGLTLLLACPAMIYTAEAVGGETSVVTGAPCFGLFGSAAVFAQPCLRCSMGSLPNLWCAPLLASAVTFYMKAIAGSAWSQDEVAGLTLTLSTWDKRTGSVPVANYTTSGQPINDQGWAHITVPFEDLAAGGDDWDLSNVEMLSWGGLDGGRYIIDEISVVDTPSEGAPVALHCFTPWCTTPS